MAGITYLNIFSNHVSQDNYDSQAKTLGIRHISMTLAESRCKQENSLGTVAKIRSFPDTNWNELIRINVEEIRMSSLVNSFQKWMSQILRRILKTVHKYWYEFDTNWKFIWNEFETNFVRTKLKWIFIRIYDSCLLIRKWVWNDLVIALNLNEFKFSWYEFETNYAHGTNLERIISNTIEVLGQLWAIEVVSIVKHVIPWFIMWVSFSASHL